MHPRIYLDNNASTPLDPRVSDFLQSLLPTLIGNPSSTHFYGQKARTLINQARAAIAAYLKIKPQELIFTSGGTEAVNMAIRGLLPQKSAGHIITSNAEHSCAFASVKQMESAGFAATFLSTGLLGAVTPDAVRSAIRPDTKLIALIAVNNETGVKTDFAAIAGIAEIHGIPFFVDAVSLLGKEVFSIPLGVTAMAFAGHKLHAPQGVGALFLRQGTKFQPSLIGGEQEFGRRAGTENILGIASFGKAVELLAEALPQATERMQFLRDKFESNLRKAFPQIIINGQGPRVCNVSNLAFKEIDGESLLISLDRHGIAASHGSACASGSLEPSRVLLNMGIPLDQVRSSIRFSLSRFTTEDEIDRACHVIISQIMRPS